MLKAKNENFYCEPGNQTLGRRVFFYFFLFFSTFGIFFISDYVNAKENCAIKIYTRNSKVDLKKIKSFFHTANLVVSRVLPSQKNRMQPYYTIVLMKEEDFKKVEILSKKRGEIRFYLPEKTSNWMNNDQITAQIIAAMLLNKAGLPPDQNYEKLPSWLVYGLLSKVQHRLDKTKIPGILTFPGVHMLLTTEPPPDLLKIASSPVKPDDGPAYKIFLETSVIFLNSIRKLPKNKEAILDLINLSIEGISSAQSFMQIFAKKVNIVRKNTTEMPAENSCKNYNGLKEWLNENAILMSVNTFKPGNASFVEKQFRKIEIVRYFAVPDPEKPNEKEERYCNVEALFAKKKEIENFNTIIEMKELDFSRLIFAAPLPFHSSLTKMKIALLTLRTNSYDDFKQKYMKAKQEFYDEIERFNKIELYVKKTELKYAPESWRYKTELEELAKWHKKHKTEWPALTKYLNQWEKEHQ